MDCTLSYFANLATIIGFITTVILLGLGYIQYRHSKKIEEAKMWIELRKMFMSYDDVHSNLSNYREWTIEDNFEDIANRNRIFAYLGLFELCQNMLENNLITEEMFFIQYGYRLGFIKVNKELMSYLNDDKEFWLTLFRLLDNYKR